MITRFKLNDELTNLGFYLQVEYTNTEYTVKLFNRSGVVKVEEFEPHPELAEFTNEYLNELGEWMVREFVRNSI